MGRNESEDVCSLNANEPHVYVQLIAIGVRRFDESVTTVVDGNVEIDDAAIGVWYWLPLELKLQYIKFVLIFMNNFFTKFILYYLKKWVINFGRNTEMMMMTLTQFPTYQIRPFNSHLLLLGLECL